MNELLVFTEFHNILFSLIICLLNFTVALKAHRLYLSTNDFKMIIITVGFLIGSVFEFLHTGYSVLYSHNTSLKTYEAIVFIYLNLSNLFLSSSILLALLYQNKNKKPAFNLNSFYFFLFIGACLSFIPLQILSSIMPEAFLNISNKLIIHNPSLEILDNALYILSAFLFFDIRRSNNQKVLSLLLLGLVTLGVGQIYIVTSDYLTSIYRFYIHFSKMLGIYLVFAGLNDLLDEVNIFSLRNKLIAYPVLLLLSFYLIFTSVSQLIYNYTFPIQIQYIFLIFLLAAIFIEYLLSSKLTSQLANAIQTVQKLSPQEKPEIIPVNSNDEIGVLIENINTSTKLLWKNNQELLIKQNQIIESNKRERLLRKIIETIRNSLDIDEIKKAIVNELGKNLTVDRVIMVEYSKEEDAFSLIDSSSEYLASPDIKSMIGFNSNEYDYFKDAFKKGKESIIQDIDEFLKKNNLFNTSDEEYVRKYEIKNGLGIPIYYGDEVIGRLVIHNTRNKKPYTQEEIIFTRTIANQAGVAMAQSNLFNKVKQKAELERLLREILTICKSNLEIQEILSTICEKISKALNVERVLIIDFKGLLNEEIIIADYKTHKEILSPRDIGNDKEDIRAYWINEIIEKGSVKILKDINSSDMPEAIKFIYEQIQLKSIVSIPLQFGENKWGGLFLLKYFTAKHWTDDEINTLRIINEQISIALRERNLYNQEKFLTNLTHELKTPIAIINGYAEALINRDTNMSQLGRQFLPIIKNNVDRISGIISNLLYLSSLKKDEIMQKLEFEQTDLFTIVNNAIEACKESANNKNINIVIECKDTVTANINKLLIEQAIINLINNAVNYSENNTEIIISILDNGNEALIKVIDQGCGIKQEHLNNIFERFYRVDKSRSRETGGAGLGLSIVKTIAEIHNGYVEVNSIPMEGSEFIFHIPK